MANVDKFLVILRCTICLVGGEIEVGIVSPGYIAVELVDGKKLDGVYTEFFEVRYFFDCLAYCTVA